MGDIKISNNFGLNASKPIDSRFVVADITARDAISFKYAGLKVYVESTGLYYFWNGTAWVDFASSGGGSEVSETFSLATGVVISGDNTDTGFTVTINVTGRISVIINGINTIVESDISGPFYFSSDGGTTATSTFLGSNLYWNQSVAGYTLDDTDEIVLKGVS